jgi:hypothetical protein
MHGKIRIFIGQIWQNHLRTMNWKEPEMSNFRYYLDTCLEVVVKTTTQTAAWSEPRAWQIRSMGKFGAANSYPVSNYRNKKNRNRKSNTVNKQLCFVSSSFRFTIFNISYNRHTVGRQWALHPSFSCLVYRITNASNPSIHNFLSCYITNIINCMLETNETDSACKTNKQVF